MCPGLRLHVAARHFLKSVVADRCCGVEPFFKVTRFDQIAKLSAGQVEALDDSLGAFRGRLTRDRVVDQADYLARGDIDGFEARFGKL